MNTITRIAVVAAFLVPASLAQAGGFGKPCTSEPEAKWMTLDALKGKVEAQGYKVQKGKIKNTCGEIYVLDKDGRKIELFLDPTTGAILGQS